MAGAPVHVNVIWDPTLGFNTHTLWDPAMTAAPPPGVPKPNIPTYAIEMLATQMWTAGYFMGANKFTTSVTHMGVPICIEDHDLGILIPDVTIPLPNLWYLIQWPTSGRKMLFTASTVQMNKKPTSCSQIAPVPLAMMTCGDPLTVPLSFPVANWANSLTVGITMGDFLLGAFKAIVSMAIDFLFDKYGPDGTPSWAGAILGKLGLKPDEIAKRTVNALAGLAFSAYEGNPTFKLSLGGGPVPEVGIQVGGEAGGEGRFGETSVAGVPVSGVWGNAPVDETEGGGVQVHDPLNVLGD